MRTYIDSSKKNISIMMIEDEKIIMMKVVKVNFIGKGIGKKISDEKETDKKETDKRLSEKRLSHKKEACQAKRDCINFVTNFLK